MCTPVIWVVDSELAEVAMFTVELNFKGFDGQSFNVLCLISI